MFGLKMNSNGCKLYLFANWLIAYMYFLYKVLDRKYIYLNFALSETTPLAMKVPYR